MEFSHLSLKGIVTPIQPLACAPMSPDREANTNEKYQQGDKRTARLPRLMVELEGGARDWTAYFPAAGIRGILRRHARDIVHHAIGQRWDLDVNRYLSIGGVTTSGSEASFNLKRQTELRKKMPLIGLFGASSDMGNTWVAGVLSLGHAVPDIPLEPTIVTGIRRDDIRLSPDTEIQYLDEASIEGLEERAHAERKSAQLRRDIKKVKRDLVLAKKAKGDVKALDKTLASFEKELESLSDLSGDVSVQMPLSGYETIPASVQLKHSVRLRSALPEEIGLFLMSLDRFALDPIIGAKTAHGCGEIKAEWEARFRTENERFGAPMKFELVPDEGLMIDGKMIGDHSWSKPFVKAFEARMAEIKTPIKEFISK